MNLRYAVRLAISASLMAGSTVLFAQDRIDEIVVTGASIRDSQAAAIEAKRNAFNVKDIISADTVGRFPDQNLADSLGRLPGVAIERDQGQARFINFRGAPTR
jgi:outer membrane receptor for ferrienterochelin and colicin